METEPKASIAHKSKYFLFIGIAFVAILMISNTIASKLIQVGPFAFSAAVVVFPISYIFGDILTEVYGYKASRRIIWSAFVAIVFMSLTYWIAQIIPPASFWTNQSAYEAILGAVPRIVIASITAFFLGEFSNSYVLSKMKIWSNGKNLWMRTIGSTIVGEGVDTIIFYTIAFYGKVPFAALFTIMYSGYLFKVLYEVVLTPVTYLIVNKLKKAEQIDVYDKGIDYNPFILQE